MNLNNSFNITLLFNLRFAGGGGSHGIPPLLSQGSHMLKKTFTRPYLVNPCKFLFLAIFHHTSKTKQTGKATKKAIRNIVAAKYNEHTERIFKNHTNKVH